jgi:Anti-sigma factor NepR
MKKTPHREGHRAARFGPEVTTRMGQQLRVMYGDVMNQGVPDHHSELLRRLDAPDQTAGE